MRPRLRSNSSSSIVKTIQTARVHGLDATEGVGVSGTQGAGAVAEAQVTLLEGQVTILVQAERACVSLAARDRAWVAIRSSRRVATPMTD
jgi:hypothetical protein